MSVENARADVRAWAMRWFEGQRDQHQWFPLVPHICHLLAEGQPVPLDRLAPAEGWPVQDVEAALRQQPGTDWDEQGRLVGFGLTLRPTPHRFTFDGRTVLPSAPLTPWSVPWCWAGPASSNPRAQSPGSRSGSRWVQSA